jgi:hypothetical protein
MTETPIVAIVNISKDLLINTQDGILLYTNNTSNNIIIQRVKIKLGYQAKYKSNLTNNGIMAMTLVRESSDSVDPGIITISGPIYAPGSASDGRPLTMKLWSVVPEILVNAENRYFDLTYSSSDSILLPGEVLKLYYNSTTFAGLNHEIRGTAVFHLLELS